MAISDLHTPVMLERCLELLEPAISRPHAVVVDGTLGLGGHSEAMLERFPDLTLVGLDRDTQALALAGERLARFGARVHLVHAVYDTVDSALAALGIPSIDGALYDLGVSSMQLDEAERGFAYAKDAPLDMRMDTTTELTAADIVATYGQGELARLFREYGEEKLAGRYASFIVRERAAAPITRTGQLVDLLQRATPAAISNQGHPAKRVFQALRIEVNQELAVLERAIPRAIAALDLGGRLVVMSYQSLEDRIVKRIFAAGSTSTAPRGLPVELPEHRPELRLLTRGAETASDAEKARNPRSAPVRLRAVERIKEAA
ncbi:16S rRNA (cytosine(1402)-N(4))-methyltransferase RsmH [Gryllotalpicola sp.]|uniref:16S rRNA (cytosine(1402)-N(4))-methyltransferase RsmH n=1 Tax=Gryllotalpicola sp. TaxID=1932787 RepID=UPI0026189A5E|nr:16S rRNA (cytosine(1402)-N(4))-methyltransferase RsmH [Gryllotalpicola sp.]